MIKLEEEEPIGPLTRSRRRAREESWSGLNLRTRVVCKNPTDYNNNYNTLKRLKVEIKEEDESDHCSGHVEEEDESDHCFGHVEEEDESDHCSGHVEEEAIDIKEEELSEEFLGWSPIGSDHNHDNVFLRTAETAESRSSLRADSPREKQQQLGGTLSRADENDNWFKITLVRSVNGEVAASNKELSHFNLSEQTPSVESNELFVSGHFLNNHFASEGSVSNPHGLHSGHNENLEDSWLDSVNTNDLVWSQCQIFLNTSDGIGVSMEEEVSKQLFENYDGYYKENLEENLLKTNYRFKTVCQVLEAENKVQNSLSQISDLVSDSQLQILNGRNSNDESVSCEVQTLELEQLQKDSKGNAVSAKNSSVAILTDLKSISILKVLNEEAVSYQAQIFEVEDLPKNLKERFESGKNSSPDLQLQIVKVETITCKSKTHHLQQLQNNTEVDTDKNKASVCLKVNEHLEGRKTKKKTGNYDSSGCRIEALSRNLVPDCCSVTQILSSSEEANFSSKVLMDEAENNHQSGFGSKDLERNELNGCFLRVVKSSTASGSVPSFENLKGEANGQVDEEELDFGNNQNSDFSGFGSNDLRENELIGCMLRNILPLSNNSEEYCFEPLVQEEIDCSSFSERLNALIEPKKVAKNFEPVTSAVSPIPEDIEQSFYWSPNVRYLDMTPFLKDFNLPKIKKAADFGLEMLRQVSTCQGISERISKEYKVKQSLGLRPPDSDWVKDIGKESNLLSEGRNNNRRSH